MDGCSVFLRHFWVGLECSYRQCNGSYVSGAICYTNAPPAALYEDIRFLSLTQSRGFNSGLQLQKISLTQSWSFLVTSVPLGWTLVDHDHQLMSEKVAISGKAMACRGPNNVQKFRSLVQVSPRLSWLEVAEGLGVPHNVDHIRLGVSGPLKWEITWVSDWSTTVWDKTLSSFPSWAAPFLDSLKLTQLPEGLCSPKLIHCDGILFKNLKTLHSEHDFDD